VLALVVFPALGLVAGFTGSLAALLVVPALLTFLAGFPLRRKWLERSRPSSPSSSGWPS
jgi:hypothetical protein